MLKDGRMGAMTENVTSNNSGECILFALKLADVLFTANFSLRLSNLLSEVTSKLGPQWKNFVIFAGMKANS